MSQGATSTHQKMAFSNPRSFNTTNSASMDSKSSGGALNSTFAGRSNAWGSSSIWSGGINGFTSSSGTRDNSVSREPISNHLGPPSEEIEGKTGSGSLVHSSVSEDYSAWGAKRNPSSAQNLSTARFPNSSQHSQQSQQSQQQPRHVGNGGLQQTFPNTAQNLKPFASRPPTLNLNATAPAQQRHSFANSYQSDGGSSRGSEQPPFAVYTKFNRPAEPSQKKPDSAIGATWADSSSTPSPSDERRPQFPIDYPRTGSMPASRDCSLPPSHHADDPIVFMQPDYARPSQCPSPDSSRAPSISSSRNGMFNSYFNGGYESMIPHFGQLGINGDSRPSTSYRQGSVANGGHSSANVSGPRSSFHSPSAGANRSEDVEEIDRTGVNYFGADDYAPPSRANTTSSRYHQTPSYAERYLQSGNQYEFRPGQPYAPSSVSTRSFELSSANGPNDWQHGTNNKLAMNRRSPAALVPQAFIDPHLQHIMAAQLRNSYGQIYNPYPLHLSTPNPYMGVLPLNVAVVDPHPTARDSSAGDGVQSALMYEFKSNTKTKRYELRDIYDHIAEFSGDQHGSRFIQTKLETANSDEKERVFREIEPNAIPLMTDVFGNYVIQKFFEHGDQTHKKILANKMRGQVLQLSLQMYGCRVVQKALDHVLVDQQAALISELEGHVLRCVKDQNGNHVIQKAIERCPAKNIEFIVAAFQGQVQHLSIHPYGCRVVQRCLEKSDLPSRSMIMTELMEGIQTMISDQFGNYVVQHIVSHDDGEPKHCVLSIVGRGLEGHSKHKFASNVVEKCLEKADDNWRRQVVFTFGQSTQRRREGDSGLIGLIKDNFGNYVVQKLLDTLCMDDYFLFLDFLHPAMQQAKRNGGAKQLLSIEKKMHRYNTYHGGLPNCGMPSNNISNNGMVPNNGVPNGGMPNNAMPNGDIAANGVPNTGIHDIGMAHNGMPNEEAMLGRPFQLQVPTSHPITNYNSAASTPSPLLTTDSRSLQSSGHSGNNGDTVEGAALSRKCSGQPADVDSPHR